MGSTQSESMCFQYWVDTNGAIFARLVFCCWDLLTPAIWFSPLPPSPLFSVCRDDGGDRAAPHSHHSGRRVAQVAERGRRRIVDLCTTLKEKTSFETFASSRHTTYAQSNLNSHLPDLVFFVLVCFFNSSVTCGERHQGKVNTNRINRKS